MVKTKTKPILPSLRGKKRYLVFEIISREKIKDFAIVSNAIWRYVFQFLGQLGIARAAILILGNKWNPELQRGIIKVSNKYVDALKASLVLANKIEEKDVIFRSIGISGILRKAEARYLEVR